MNVRYYHGERIYFRPIELGDAALLTVWLNDPENWKTLGRSNPINQLREQAYIENLYKSDTDVSFGVALKKNDRLIGCCGLHGISAINRSAEFGILIGDRSRQGLGFGTETTRLMLRYAFEERNLNRVELSVFADNERGIRAYKAAGFVLEGRNREAYFRNGAYHDGLRFAILRSDWRPPEADDDAVREAAIASLTS